MDEPASMKHSNKYYGAGGTVDNNSESDPDILDRVKVLAPKAEKLKATFSDKAGIAAARAFEKSINEPGASKYAQNKPDYTPAARTPALKLQKQVKRGIVIPKQAKRSFKK